MQLDAISGAYVGNLSLKRCRRPMSAACNFKCEAYDQLLPTVRNLPGIKWYGGHGPLSATSQFFNCFIAVA